jgi:kynurenine formamidase
VTSRAAQRPPVSGAELQQIFEQVKNWGRWGVEDEAGALNYLTPDHVRRAAALVRDGVTISLASDFPVQLAPDNLYPAQHMMVMGGDARKDHGVPGLETALDYIGISYHGMACSHIDALCHVFVDGRMYNNRDALEVRSTGARHNDIMAARDGIVGRGLLLDLPGLRGVDWLEPDTVIEPEELIECEQHQGVDIHEGDILLVSTGRFERRASLGPWDTQTVGLAGLSARCAALLHQRRIAALAGDGVNDPLPSATIEGWAMPLHMCCLVGMGVHLFDNLDLSQLAWECRARRRYEFLFSAAPLRVVGGTGSPVNPLGIL